MDKWSKSWHELPKAVTRGDLRRRTSERMIKTLEMLDILCKMYVPYYWALSAGRGYRELPSIGSQVTYSTTVRRNFSLSLSYIFNWTSPRLVIILMSTYIHIYICHCLSSWSACTAAMLWLKGRIEIERRSWLEKWRLSLVASIFYEHEHAFRRTLGLFADYYIRSRSSLFYPTTTSISSHTPLVFFFFTSVFHTDHFWSTRSLQTSSVSSWNDLSLNIQHHVVFAAFKIRTTECI